MSHVNVKNAHLYELLTLIRIRFSFSYILKKNPSVIEEAKKPQNPTFPLSTYSIDVQYR